MKRASDREYAVTREPPPRSMAEPPAERPGLGLVAAEAAPRRKKYRLGSIAFLALLTAVTLIGCPFYLLSFGLTAAQLAFFVVYTLASSFAITLGYHRLFSHASFKAAWPIRLVVLFFGGAAFEQSALRWSALHRQHHRHTDTDLDPYNINRGFFYAHVGWVLLRLPHFDYSNVRDLTRDRIVLHQHQHYRAWSYLSGVAIPLFVGAWVGGWTYAILFPVAARIFLVLNSAFFINSAAHSFGSRPFQLNSSARDHWLGVLITNGEGYHNFHHAFPRDYRNGIRWYDWDPTKWIIWSLSRVGLTSDLKRTNADSVRLAKAQVANAERAPSLN
ncbi:MAG: fatty acid desaturase [Caulobacteraceae bacterium]|nr:fatty acid desaturase [Caulobacteraceae bacterium]